MFLTEEDFGRTLGNILTQKLDNGLTETLQEDIDITSFSYEPGEIVNALFEGEVTLNSTRFVSNYGRPKTSDSKFFKNIKKYIRE